MIKKTRSRQRREESLSRDRIIAASIEILDNSGESGLTFRALSERLATGAGAIYWHIENKSDLLTAACDAIVARTMASCVIGATPPATLRALALGMFDAIDAHPWVGSALTHAAGQLPLVRIVECIGQQVRALGVPDNAQWAAVSTLLHFILGVGGQNAANTQFALTRGIDRSDFLEEMSTAWSRLDAHDYPFVRIVAGQLRIHDDRVDFLAGIDLILGGIGSPQVADDGNIKRVPKRLPRTRT
ncbi:TetR/AcrR family transcriptional regulator [Pseudolysobacter antarcticus]|uniref:TetR/AcrR family transcriptional regulator n=1 Tax=Pseudolysobacter antarcticus TaxID=2511995 RepID=A0A411HKX3_9GAMM|nr:TetR/AcrR family transcriptional regulator [Pseudolysobacter antarcticus]QBB71050.1 TetR/AcrR family transcriptional regulator [Pseudolysobacter antarcticus]